MSWFGSSPRKTTLFYVVLIAIASLVVGMVIASRLELSSTSSAQAIAIPATNTAPLAGPVDATTFRNIAKAQSPMVVSIRTESRQRTQDLSEFFGGGGDDLLDRFFGGPGAPGAPQQSPRRRQQPRERLTQAAGSGFIINKDGFILTNNHVVEGASKIEVQFFDDEYDYYEAKVVGRDPLTDSALLQLVEKPTKPLVEAKFGDSSQMEPGDWVMAIGNPFGLDSSVTSGIVSAKGRHIGAGPYDDFLQTDAPVNPGSSGGPLINMRAEVVGINTAIVSQTGGNIGIAFATPINLVKDLVPQLKEKGKVTRGSLGVVIQRVTPSIAESLGTNKARGALVAGVAKGGPAHRAGIKMGDVITQFDGKEIKEPEDLPIMVARTPVNKSVPLKVVRETRELTVAVTIGELKEEGGLNHRSRKDTKEESPRG